MASNTRNVPAIAFSLDRDIQEFLIDRQARNLTFKTLQWYEHSLGIFQKFVREHDFSTVDDLNAGIIRRFLLHLSERGHNAGGVHNIFGAVKAFLRWYEDEYAPEDWKNPLKKVKTPKRPQEPLKPLDIADLQAMLATCPIRTFMGDRDRALLLFLIDTGVRLQELTDLVIGDVDFNSGSVLVRQGKGRKPRVVFIGAKTRRVLLVYLRHCPCMEDAQPLWLTQRGDKLSRKGIIEVVRRRARAAGLPEPGLHAFRRAFAINCLRNGMDLVSLQRLLGHSSLQIINRYLYFLEDDLKQAHSKHGVVDRML